MKLKTGLLTAAMLVAPGAAFACGGLFCNNSQPVTQSAERILFAQDGDTVYMHVRLSYAGPPQDFGWLLPVPPDVETALSSEALFQRFDQQFGPRFAVQTEFHENCNNQRGLNFPSSVGISGGADDGSAEFSPQDPGVQIISREAVGPYDRVILQADNVQVLRAWLDENEFQVPEKTDETLIPYIENGAVFVALKLLPGTDAGDVQPLRLKFTAPSATIPIVPTSVAASPDMGIIVHVLGQSRAIPKNYAHIQINDAAIDWFNGGQNYADVVSKAADDAMGKAFATDYAGPSAGIIDSLPLINEQMLNQIRGMETVRDLINNVPLDADMGRLLGDSVKIPEGVSPTQFWQCPQCFDIDLNAAIDGEAIAAQIEVEINAPRKELAKLFDDNPYLSRLYTTLSAAEMDLDPTFAFNPDLDDVNNRYTATQKIFCDSNGEVLPSLTYLETPSGVRMPVSDNSVPDPIARQGGATVRGMDVPGARIIEQIAERGQPMVIEDLTSAIRARYNDDVAQPSVGGGGCQSTDAPASLAGLFGLLALVFRRRR